MCLYNQTIALVVKDFLNQGNFFNVVLGNDFVLYCVSLAILMFVSTQQHSSV